MAFCAETVKTKSYNKISVRRSTLAMAFGIMIAAQLVMAPIASAANYKAEIQQLQNKNNTNDASRKDLQTTEVSLEQKIANLQATIASLAAQIADNEAKRADLERKIAEAQAEILRQQDLLGKTIRQLYIDNDVSMLEKVASSKTLSEYVDKEQYKISVQAKIQESLDRIHKLKKQQESQKQLVEKLLADNKVMQTQATAEKQEVDKLLALNQQQQTQYTQEITANNAKITDLQRAQAEENARFLREQAALAEAARQRALALPRNAAPPVAPASSAAPAGLKTVNGRAYPWASVYFPNSLPDPWGMYKRQCVSYTAWKVAASGRHMPYWGGRGNAKNWDDNARAAGIPVDYRPRVGDVAVRNAGTYGHVMYVDGVNGDGSINISQYNASWTGAYSEARIFPGDLVFIHF